MSQTYPPSGTRFALGSRLGSRRSPEMVRRTAKMSNSQVFSQGNEPIRYKGRARFAARFAARPRDGPTDRQNVGFPGFFPGKRAHPVHKVRARFAARFAARPRDGPTDRRNVGFPGFFPGKRAHPVHKVALGSPGTVSTLVFIFEKGLNSVRNVHGCTRPRGRTHCKRRPREPGGVASGIHSNGSCEQPPSTCRVERPA